MSDVTIYHNPRCSKSRQTLALLEERGIQPEIRKYLEDAPSSDELKALLGYLNIGPRQLLRSKEAEYQEHGLDNSALTDDEIIAVMCACPKLIERPIVIKDQQARIGRPPEAVLEIL